MTRLVRKHFDDALGRRRFGLFDGPTLVHGPYGSHYAADAALDNLEHPAPRPRTRKCLCCSETFRSSGPGNRMCPTCRRRTQPVAV